MQTINNIIHQKLSLKSSFETFTSSIEKVLNRLPPNWSERMSSDPGSIQNYLSNIAGNAGLMIFGDQNHGGLLTLKNMPRKAVQYTIGNPLIAMDMTAKDIRAALYAPVRILVYEDDQNELFVEYDLPSSQFGQFGKDIFSIAQTIDIKLEAAIFEADTMLESDFTKSKA